MPGLLCGNRRPALILGCPVMVQALDARAVARADEGPDHRPASTDCDRKVGNPLALPAARRCCAEVFCAYEDGKGDGARRPGLSHLLDHLSDCLRNTPGAADNDPADVGDGRGEPVRGVAQQTQYVGPAW